MKTKILYICTNLSEPYVSMSGNSAIFEQIKGISKTPQFEVSVLTSYGKDSKKLSNTKSLRFHYIFGENLVLLRIKFFFTAIKLGLQNKYHIIHDYSSIPQFSLITGLIGVLTGAKSFHTLSTVNTSRLAQFCIVIKNNFLSNFIFTDYMSQKKFGELFDKSTWIPLTRDLEEFLKLRYSRNIYQAKNVVFIGSLEERKGSQVLARSLEEVVFKNPGAKFSFVSYGSEIRDSRYEENLSALMKSLKGLNKNVKFITGKKNILKVLENASVFVLPATSRNGTLGQPLTLIEALASGRPCIVSDIYKDEIGLINNKTCLTFKDKDSTDLAKKINVVLGDFNKAKKLSAGARLIEDTYDKDKNISLLVNTYSSVL